jgi:putative tricarboxylic transport membrane protein
MDDIAMTVRADHVAGAAFVGFGVLVFALSGDLPTGHLSMPGAGFMPRLIAGLTILLGLSLVFRARESEPFASIDWSDLRHAAPVVAITAAAIAVYTVLGFIVTMVLLMLALLTLVERRNIFRAALFSVIVAMGAYGVFAILLQAPLPIGPLGF